MITRQADTLNRKSPKTKTFEWREPDMTLTRRHFLLGIAAGTTAVAGYTALPRDAAAETPRVYAPNDVALGGTDPVAYFTMGKAVQGSPVFTYNYDGARWYFSSEAHRAAFAADPTAYAPQYGGYCAYAVSEGYTATSTPKAWRIVDGKLYLNNSRRIRRRWEKDIATRINNANINWPKVLE